MRLVGCVPVLPPSALLVKGCSGSGLIGPWPFPAGGSCQSATFDCQPKSAEVRLGILSFGSASAAVAIAATTPAKTAPARATCRGADACFETARDIVVSLVLRRPAPPFCDVCP